MSWVKPAWLGTMLCRPLARPDTVTWRSTSFSMNGRIFRPVLIFVVVRIAVDDQNIVKVTLHRLLACVCEQLGRVELFYRNAATALDHQFHGLSPPMEFSEMGCSAAGPALPHAEFEHGEIDRAQESARRGHDFG